MKSIVTFLILLITFSMNSQNLPYYELEEVPKEYTAGTVASRMVDGLGFRYYWATEGLTVKDLKYKPTKEARTTLETIDHILVLSVMTLSALEGKEVDFSKDETLSFEDIRKMTLENFKKSSEILKNAKDLSSFKMKIKRRNGSVEEYPFWNQLNGPIADAIWHVGQVVTFRRTAGNPLPKGVSLLTGKVRK
ncbi:DinB family protein [Tenacibaculum halocynthiae]|uniref:DinB family protein n=1 Tax=Tenacibaculum halocynthiae TaxID=1254437 RepID=UPI003895D944